MAEQVSSISWSHDFESSSKQAASQQRHVLVDFTAAPM
jgi:hypothetical protein